MAETKNTKAFYNTYFTGDWEIVDLGTIAKIKHGRDQKQIEVKNGIYPILATGGEIGRTNTPLYSKPSVLIGRKGTIDKPKYMDTPFWTVDTLFYTEISDKVVPLWLYFKFETINWYLYNEASGVPSLSASTISKIKIPLPPLPEQKAIAHVLGTADAAIHTTSTLIAQKELRKKWLMQQLLSGKKRLNGFKGEWKFVRFKEIYSQVKQKAGNDKHLVLSVTKDGIVSQAEYFNKEIASEDTSPYLVVRKGDMVMSGLNFWMGSIDVLSEYESGMVSPAYKVFEIHNPEISAEFMKTFVRSEIMLQCLLGSSVVGASIVRRNLDRETLDEWSFKIPSLKEQTAIAQVLQAADKEISLLKAKAEKLREQKKGLMQVLLTGKVRLNNINK